jgi:hypothetical protein
MSEMSPIFWSSEPITAVPFNLDASHSSADWAGTACEVLDAVGAGAAGAGLEVGGACASAVDIIKPLTVARTSVLLMSYLLGCKPPW